MSLAEAGGALRGVDLPAPRGNRFGYNARVMADRRQARQGGFTLLEILVAMTILAMGGVLVLSLFAAAVALQSDAEADRRRAEILNEVSAAAQDAFDAFQPTPEAAVPPPVARREASTHSRDFEYAIVFAELPGAPKGEGAVARIDLWFQGRRLDEVERVLKRTVFTKTALEELRSYAMDREAAEAAKRAAADERPDERRR